MASQFGTLLRDLRGEAGMTQEQLAEASGLSVRTIHRLETGTPNDTRMGTVKRAAHALADALGRERDAVWQELLSARIGVAVVPETAGAAGVAGTTAGAAVEAGAASLASAPVPARSSAPGGSAPVPAKRVAMPYRGALTGVAETLAHNEHGRWTFEEERRRVHDPRPLPVKWSSARANWVDHPDNVHGTGSGPASEPPSLSGGLSEIADTYRRIESGRLVVLGRAGSGKTVLTLRFVLDYLRTRVEGEPVPVVFSLGSWDPTAVGLREWLVGRLLRDNPDLDARAPDGSTTAAALLAAGWILPVLDGFDEIAGGLHGAALDALNASTLPFLLTSRTGEFADAVTATDVLTRAAGVELTDLTTADLAEYLPLTARPTAPAGPGERSATVWDPVVDRLVQQPDSPACRQLGAVLSRPLMVVLARTVYSNVPGRDPAVLLDTDRFPTPEALEEHLLAGFVPTVYRPQPPPLQGPATRSRRPRTWDPDRALRYAGHLAAHLDRDQEHGHQDLAWWQLAGAVRPAVRILAVTVASAMLTALADWLVYWPLDVLGVGRTAFEPQASVLDALLFGPAVGLAFGLIYGFVTVFDKATIEPSRTQLRLVGLRRRAEGPSMRRRFLSWFGIGCVGGMAVGVAYGPALVLEGRILFGQTAYGGDAVKATLVNMLVFGVVFGLAAGCVLGSVAALEAPVDVGSAATPTGLLLNNRTTVLRQVAVVAPALAVAIAVLGWATVELLRGDLGNINWPTVGGLVVGAVGGISGAASYALAFTAWGQWVLFTRICLPLAGRLPWRVVAYLDDAHQRGVLRQAGAVYQFRHARLQQHLSQTYLDMGEAAADRGSDSDLR